MKQTKVFRGFYIWKWGFNFNEGGMVSRWIPFCIAVNLANMRLFLWVGFPWLRYGKPLNRLSEEKEWGVIFKQLFQLVIYKNE